MAVPLKLSIRHTTQPGEHLHVIGSNPALGEWNVSQSKPLTCVSHPLWSCQLTAEPFSRHEYKYLLKREEGGGEVVWELEGKNNRVLESVERGLSVDDGEFGVEGRREVTESKEGEGKEGTAENAVERMEEDVKGSAGDVRSIKRSIRELKGKTEESKEVKEGENAIQDSQEMIADVNTDGGEETKEASKEMTKDLEAATHGQAHKEETQQVEKSEKEDHRANAQDSNKDVWSELDNEMTETLKDIDKVKEQLNKVRARKSQKAESKLGVGISLVVVAMMFVGACVAVFMVTKEWRGQRKPIYI